MRVGACQKRSKNRRVRLACLLLQWSQSVSQSVFGNGTWHTSYLLFCQQAYDFEEIDSGSLDWGSINRVDEVCGFRLVI
jgi:hypothetical protein